MASYQISAPDNFNFSCPDKWPCWIQKFERFCMASGLNDKAEANQVNTLIYTMGDSADDILRVPWVLAKKKRVSTTQLRVNLLLTSLKALM